MSLNYLGWNYIEIIKWNFMKKKYKKKRNSNWTTGTWLESLIVNVIK